MMFKKLVKFPKLVKSNKTFLYKGLISVKDQSFWVELESDDQNKLLKFYCEWRLKDLLNDDDICALLVDDKKQSINVDVFLHQISELVLAKLSKKNSQGDINNTNNDLINIINNNNDNSNDNDSNNLDGISFILKQLEELGWDKLHHIDRSFTDVQLKCIDKGDRSHLMSLKFENIHQKPSITFDLPPQFIIVWDEETTLSDVYIQFQHHVNNLQPYFDLINELDLNSTVLDPTRPSFADPHRRLFIAPGISMEIRIDPFNPTNVPQFTIYGGDQAVSQLQISLYENSHRWNKHRPLLDNLQNVFETKFPNKSAKMDDSNSSDPTQIDCGLCFNYDMDGELPEIYCSASDTCKMVFHHSCLIEWLRYQMTTKQSFGVLFGVCPNCSQAISVSE